MVENRTGPNRLVQARTVLCKNRTGGGGHGRESIRLYQARVRNEQGIEQVVAWGRIEHTRKGIKQACARTEQVVGIMVENRKYLFIFERESNMLA